VLKPVNIQVSVLFIDQNFRWIEVWQGIYDDDTLNWLQDGFKFVKHDSKMFFLEDQRWTKANSCFTARAQMHAWKYSTHDLYALWSTERTFFQTFVNDSVSGFGVSAVDGTESTYATGTMQQLRIAVLHVSIYWAKRYQILGKLSTFAPASISRTWNVWNGMQHYVRYASSMPSPFITQFFLSRGFNVLLAAQLKIRLKLNRNWWSKFIPEFEVLEMDAGANVLNFPNMIRVYKCAR
jgi:hypothetical protein